MNFKLFLFLFLFIGCDKFQTVKSKEIYYKKFNWRIKVPENLEAISREDWAKYQEKGVEAIENTYGEEVENNSKIIFVFRKGQTNYFEANYQPFDEEIDGDYNDSFDAVNEILIETFKNNIPNLTFEKNRTTKTIDGLIFQVSELKLNYPNNVVLYANMYSRLFGNEEFTVNITYTDKTLGKQMIESFLNSKFGK